MITGININATVDFVSTHDNGEPKTIWKIGAIDSDVFDMIGDYAQNPLRMTSEVIRFGLRGIENFKDSYGNDVRFDTVNRQVGRRTYQVVADNIMRIIPPEVKAELSDAILKLSKLSGEESKN